MAEIGSSSGWSQEQLRNARIIIQVGQSMGMQQRDIRVALMTAMQESGLQNLNYGDSDSLGLFQQRPSQGWGTPGQVTDPQYAAKAFYSALKGISGRDDLRLTQEAQAVQRSAYPDAYAQWADDAAGLLQNLGFSGHAAPQQQMTDEFAGFKAMTKAFAPSPITADLHSALAETSESAIGLGASTTPMDFSDLSDVMMPTYTDKGQWLKAAGVQGAGQGGWRHDFVDKVKQLIGVPYVWGGSDPSTGLDCSGLTSYAYKKFLGIDLPRVSYEQAGAGRRISLNNLKPGDLVFWDFGANGQNPQGADHVAIYIGHGHIIEAPRPGESVQISQLYDTNLAWGVRIRRG